MRHRKFLAALYAAVFLLSFSGLFVSAPQYAQAQPGQGNPAGNAPSAPAAPAPTAGDAPAASTDEATAEAIRQAQDENETFLEDLVKSGFSHLINLILFTVAQLLLKLLELMAYLFALFIDLIRWVLGPGLSIIAEQPQVGIGWRIVRDIINSFFIVVLIAIAISTIIRFQQYNFRSTLPRLLLAALLVNFSRTICLLAINFANAVMATFSSAVVELLPAFALGLRLPALTALDFSTLGGLYGRFLDSASTTDTQTIEKTLVSNLSIIGSIILAMIMMLFSLAALVMFVIILLFRIIVLWFLVILSPLAFFLWGVPGRASSYWGQWLQEFIQHVLVGPVAAFFLYLIIVFFLENISNAYGYTPGIEAQSPVLNVASQPEVMVGYLFSLGLMFIALEVIEQMGVRGGQFARRVAVEGIAQRGLNMARGAAGYFNDYLYSKGLSVRPGNVIEAVQKGIAGRRADWIRQGQEVNAERAKQAEARGGLLSAVAWNAIAENDKFFEKEGSWQLAKRAMLSPVSTVSGAIRSTINTPGVLRGQAAAMAAAAAAAPARLKAGLKGAPGGLVGAIADKGRSFWNLSAGTDEIFAQADELKKKEDFRTGLSSATAGSGSIFGGMTVGGVQSLAVQLENIKKQKLLTDLTAKIAAAGGAAAPEDIAEQARLAGEVGGFVPSAAATAIAADPERAGKVESIAKALSENVGHVDSTSQTIRSIQGKLDATKDTDKAKRMQYLNDGGARLQKMANAVSSVRAQLSQKMDEAHEKLFKDFEEYDATGLSESFLGFMQKGDLPEMMAVLKQAGKQKDIRDVLEGLNLPGVTGDAPGVDNLMKYLKANVGLDDQAIGEMEKVIQAAAKKNDDYDLQGRVKSTRGGRSTQLDAKERDKKIADSIKRTPPIKLLKSPIKGWNSTIMDSMTKDMGLFNEALKNIRGEMDSDRKAKLVEYLKLHNDKRNEVLADPRAKRVLGL